MRHFKLQSIDPPLEEGHELEVIIGQTFHFDPIIKNYYELNGKSYRCIEHHKGRSILTDDIYRLLFKELF